MSYIGNGGLHTYSVRYHEDDDKKKKRKRNRETEKKKALGRLVSHARDTVDLF